jgi:hypothetical protein
MKAIVVTGVCGEKELSIKLSCTHGAANMIQILIDNYYHGMFNKVNGEWVAFIHAKSFLCSNDILVMRELIETNNLSPE